MLQPAKTGCEMWCRPAAASCRERASMTHRSSKWRCLCIFRICSIMRLTPHGISSQEDSMLIEAQCPQLAHADRLKFLSESRQATGTLALMASQSFANREVIGLFFVVQLNAPWAWQLIANASLSSVTARVQYPASVVLFVTAARRRLRIKSRLMDLRMLQRIAERMRRICPWIIASRRQLLCS